MPQCILLSEIKKKLIIWCVLSGFEFEFFQAMRFKQFHYLQLTPNMVSQLEKEFCCIKHSSDVCDQNNIVNSVYVED